MGAGGLLRKVVSMGGGPASLEQRAESRYRLRVGITQMILGGAILAAWQAYGIRDPLFLSYPTAIFGRLTTWVTDGSLWFHLLFTVEAMVLGFIAGSSTGIFAGFILGRNLFWADVLDVYITSVNSLPKIALAPLLVLWFGIGLLPKVVLAAVIVFFFVFINTYTGVREVDPDLIDMVRLMGAGKSQIVKKVVFPHALTWIFAGLKLAAPYALIGAVMGEIIASNRGIGYLISGSANKFDTAGTFAGLLVLLIICSLMNMMIARLERRWTGWKKAGVEGGGAGVA